MWIAQNPEDDPVNQWKNQVSSTIHILLVVSHKGHVLPPHFFGPGQTVTKEVYLDILMNVVKP